MPKRMTMLGDGKMRKGQIWVCSNCCNVSVLGDNDLHPMTKPEFEAFPKPIQAAIARTVIEIKRRIDGGGSWDPFSTTKGNGE